eukprot:10039992-Ditylum_brightwellii.AAC.1
MEIAATEGFDPEEVLKDIRIQSSDKIKKRRPHRRKFYKTIGFVALTKHIAAKWKTLDDTAKIPFEVMAMKEKQRYRNSICKWNEAQKMKNHKVDVNGLNAVAVVSTTQMSETPSSDEMMWIGDATVSQNPYLPYSVRPQKERYHPITRPAFDSPSTTFEYLNVNMKNFVFSPSNPEDHNIGGNSLWLP